MDQSLTYVKDQLAQGKTRDQIKMALLGGGWQPTQVDALFAKFDAQSVSAPAPVIPPTVPVSATKPVEPIVASAPITNPKPAATPINTNPAVTTKLVNIDKPKILSADVQPNTSKPDIKIPNKTEQPKKSSLWKMIGWTALSIAIAVAALLGAAYYLGQKNKTATTDTAIAPTPTTATYSANGLTFAYPLTWKKTSIATLLGTSAPAATDVQQDLFFTSANYTTIQQTATQVDKTDAIKLANFAVTAGNLASLSVTYVPNASACPTVAATTPGVTITTPTCTPPTSDATAKNQIITVLKTTYAADGTATTDTAATVDQAKIKTATAGGAASYWAVSGPTAKPFVVLSMPASAGAFTMSFPGATTLDTLSSNLETIYASIKVQ